MPMCEVMYRFIYILKDSSICIYTYIFNWTRVERRVKEMAKDVLLMPWGPSRDDTVRQLSRIRLRKKMGPHRSSYEGPRLSGGLSTVYIIILYIVYINLFIYYIYIFI